MKPQEYLDREDEYENHILFLTQLLHGMLFRLTLMDGRGIFRMRKIKKQNQEWFTNRDLRSNMINDCF